MSFLSNIAGVPVHKENSKINFILDDNNALSVTIDIKRDLHLRSVTSSEEDLCSYASLFGNKKVMEKYATGQTKTEDEMRTRINDIWVDRWHKGDPFSALAIFKSNVFMGHVVLGHGDAAGESELAYLLKEEFWNRKLGTKIVDTIVNEYAPAIIENGFLLEGKPLTRITATTRFDNIASKKILKNVRMHKVGEEEKFGALREHYAINIPLRGLYV